MTNQLTSNPTTKFTHLNGSLPTCEHCCSKANQWRLTAKTRNSAFGFEKRVPTIRH